GGEEPVEGGGHVLAQAVDVERAAEHGPPPQHVSRFGRQPLDPAAATRQGAGIVLALLDDPMARRMATDDPVPAVRKAVQAALPGGA
ncbi:MAG TPA: hypothetical protein PK948_10280, partial [Gemmatimonadales bacterium]|nr:hypothetical protein [Gemmatimonadales bacterium]